MFQYEHLRAKTHLSVNIFPRSLLLKSWCSQLINTGAPTWRKQMTQSDK